MNQKINFPTFVEAVSKLTGIPSVQLTPQIKAIFEQASNSIAMDGNADIENIGNFKADNGEIRFIPSKELAEKTNSPFAMFESVTLHPDYTDPASEPEQQEQQGQQESVLPEAAESAPATEASETPGNSGTPAEAIPTPPKPPVYIVETAITATEENNTPENKELASANGNTAVASETVSEPVTRSGIWVFILGMVLGIAIGAIGTLLYMQSQISLLELQP